jgi:hypothetical protein
MLRKQLYIIGGSDLRIRWIGFVALLLLMLFMAPLNSLADPRLNSSENISLTPVNNTSTPFVEFVGVQGIWRVSMAGTDLTMALNQSGDSIFGRCKFEGADPWNGLVAGSLSGKMVNIAVAAMQGKVLVSTLIIGMISGDSIQGSYASYDDNGILAKDTFTATKISPDVSSYTPARITASSLSAAEQPQTVQQTATPIGQQPQTPTTIGQQYQTQKSRVTDVTQLAKGIDPNIMPRHAPL